MRVNLQPVLSPHPCKSGKNEATCLQISTGFKYQMITDDWPQKESFQSLCKDTSASLYVGYQT